MLNQLTSAIDFHGQALNLRAERQRLIASNIANADTPGYVARDINFSQALRDATGGQRHRVGTVGRLDTTQPGHIAGSGASPAAATPMERNQLAGDDGPRVVADRAPIAGDVAALRDLLA